MRQTDKTQNYLIDISKLPPAEALEAQRVQKEYDERTFWRNERILTWAKAISMVIIVATCSVALILLIYDKQNASLLEKILNIFACVLSFLAGRSKHL